MKTFLLTLSAVFFSAIAQAGSFESDYGIGIVSVHPYNYLSVSFWKTPKDKIAYDQLYFENDSGSPKLRCGFSTTGIDSVPAWFSPESFCLDEYKLRFNMRCIRRENGWCEVMVNNKTGEVKWVELGADIQFHSWEEFYKSMVSVEMLTGDPKLFEKPSGKSKSSIIASQAEAGSRQLIRAVRIEGEWMYVEVTEYDASHKEISRRQGWVRWRDADKPLIGYTILSC